MDGSTAVEIASCIAAIAVGALLFRESWRSWQPMRLLLAGRYAEARRSAERLERSWMRLFGSVRQSAAYSIACAQHMSGELEESLSTLARLRPRLAGNVRYAVCSLEAANLVLLGRDHARALARLDEASQIHRPPEDLLLAAHLHHALGEDDTARALFEAAGSERSRGGARLGSVVLFEDRRQQSAIFHYLRGQYLVAVGRRTDARRDLEIAASSAVTSVYVERARALLEARPVDEDAPSSLAPQVVAKDVT